MEILLTASLISVVSLLIYFIVKPIRYYYFISLCFIASGIAFLNNDTLIFIFGQVGIIIGHIVLKVKR